MLVTSYSKKQLKESVGSQLHFLNKGAFGMDFRPNGVNKVCGRGILHRHFTARVKCLGGVIQSVKF